MNTVNHVTEAVTKMDKEFISIVATGGARPYETQLVMSNGKNLGCVQSATWSLSVGDYARLNIETIAAPAELKAFLRDTTLHVRPAATYHPLRYLWDYYVTKAAIFFGLTHSS